MGCWSINSIDACLFDFEKATELLQLIFLTSGTDGYEIFAEKTTQDAGLPLREFVVDIIRKRGVVNARVEGRSVRKLYRVRRA